MEEQLRTAAHFLDIPAEFLHIPNYIFATFGDAESGSDSLQHVKHPQGLSLGQLRETHTTYLKVISDEISAVEGNVALRAILKQPKPYSKTWMLILAFLAGFVICPSGFDGSVADAVIAGTLSMGLMALQIWGCRSSLYVHLFE